MWRTCVWSSLRYALHATGLTSEHVLKIRGVVATHLRAIACSPRHLTGETNSSLHARLDVLDPVEQLQQESGHLVNRLRALGGNVDSTLAWAPEILQQAERVQQLLQTQAESSAKLIPVDADCEGVPRPRCGIYFLSERALATRVGHKHPEILQQAAATSHRCHFATRGLGCRWDADMCGLRSQVSFMAVAEKTRPKRKV